ncbi:MAG: hypothetical protein M8857_05940, partial [marine benthic group bacterium]|nr:hypothetical protein [Gemmatimonadota bacterium]
MWDSTRTAAVRHSSGDLEIFGPHRVQLQRPRAICLLPDRQVPLVGHDRGGRVAYQHVQGRFLAQVVHVVAVVYDDSDVRRRTSTAPRGPKGPFVISIFPEPARQQEILGRLEASRR